MKYIFCNKREQKRESKYIRAGTKFNIDIFLPDLLEIICHNIAPNLTGQGPSYIVESFRLDHRKKLISYNPRTVKTFKVNSDLISNVSFTITDQNNIPILFSLGVPTIIKLKIFEMNNQVKNFYVKTSNFDSKNIFTDNKSRLL